MRANDGSSAADDGSSAADEVGMLPAACTTVMDTRYYQYQALNSVQPPIWDGSRLLKVPAFTWGGRVSNSPPSVPYPGILNTSRTWDISTSLTKVAGRHTMKTGFYHTYALKAEPDGASTSAAFGTVTFTNDSSNRSLRSRRRR